MFGSDVLLRQLAHLGITHAALNPGATLTGLHESLLNGDSGIRPISCLHEGIAVGIAHGYAKAAGRPMVVGLHDTVGLLNGVLGVFNAWADSQPMLIVNGVGPQDAGARRPWIDWVHTSTDAPRPVRDMLVWAETPANLAALVEATRRAHARCRSTVPGPALIGLDQAVADTAVADVPPVLDGAPVWRTGPDPAEVGALARTLAAARRPVFVTDRPLTDVAAARLGDIAAHLDAALVDLGAGGNVPYGHPCDATERAREVLAAGDVVVLVDVRDPGLALDGRPTANQVVAEVGALPLRDSTWIVPTSSLVGSQTLVCEPELAIAALADALEAPPARPWRTPAPPDRAWPSRRSAVDKRAIACAAAETLPSDSVAVTHGGLDGHARRELRLSRPSQFLGRSGGEGLGYALPASIGAALAWQGSQRIPVAFLTDGDTLYLPQALWTAAHERVPLLAVVENDRRYERDERHQRRVASERGRDPERAAEGVWLTEPAVDFAALARAMGVDAAGPVRTYGELLHAMAVGLEAVESGSPFLIEALTRP